MQFSTILCRTRHRRLPSGIGTKQTLTGSLVKKVSAPCRLRVDHVYSGTLSGTLILVPFSCHKTGTSSPSMERFQTGSLSNNVKQLGRMSMNAKCIGECM